MDEEDKIAIRINVADRFYPLRIKPADEENLRKAAKRINEQVSEYMQNFKNRDAQDALSISVLKFAMKLIKVEEATDIAPVVSGVQQLNKELGEYLQNSVS
jgi:cell division protein ZapA